MSRTSNERNKAQALYQPSGRLKQRQVLRTYTSDGQYMSLECGWESALVQFKICYICSIRTIRDKRLDRTWHYETYLISGRYIEHMVGNYHMKIKYDHMV